MFSIQDLGCLFDKMSFFFNLYKETFQYNNHQTANPECIYCFYFVCNLIMFDKKKLQYKHKRVNIASSVLPTLHVKDESFLIYDEKYAAKLQLQEALLQSEFQINTSRSSASSQNDPSSSSWIDCDWRLVADVDINFAMDAERSALEY